MTKKEDGLLEISYNPSYISNTRRTFGKGEVKDVLKQIFDSNSKYTFIQTTANPEAVQALKGYVGIREEFDKPWRVRKIRRGENPVYCLGANDKLNGLWFSPELNQIYLLVLEELAERVHGKNTYAQFPIVFTQGFHSLHLPNESLNWPVVHVVKDFGVNDFDGLLRKIHESEGKKIIRGFEQPQNYKMGEIQKLEKLGISPLVRTQRVWEVDGKVLREALDFLVPFRFVEEWTGLVIDAD